MLPARVARDPVILSIANSSLIQNRYPVILFDADTDGAGRLSMLLLGSIR